MGLLVGDRLRHAYDSGDPAMRGRMPEIRCLGPGHGVGAGGG
jgi:hypothetical protein